ncbi:hypothetical protein FI667_g1178, partial [Globisporangium splendens]
MTQLAREYALGPPSGGAENHPPNHHRHHHSHREGGVRKPLEKSRLSVVGKNKNPKKYPPPAQLQPDDTEFYTNIWTAPATTGRRKQEEVHKFIDISQVAYVVTTIDYKRGYEGGAEDHELENIWQTGGVASLASSLNSIDVEMSRSERQFSNMTNLTDITEVDEDDMRPSHATEAHSEVPSSGGGTSFRGRLHKGVSAEELEMVTSVPVSGPLRRGDSIVFSPVLATNNQVDQTWNARFLLGIHEPVRHALFVIDCFLDRVHRRSSPMEWNVNEFFVWFKMHFVEFLKNQHTVKTKVVLPLLQVDYMVKREILEHYGKIYDLLDAIIAQEDTIVLSAASASSSWQDRLFVLQSDIRKLNLLTNSILTAEERVFSPMLARTFNEQNFQRYVVPRIFRASKPKRVVIPWIVERYRVWGGDKEAQAYKDDLPFTARFLYDRMWLPYFVSHVAQAMKHLDTEMTGMMNADASDSWFGCSIQ